MKRIQAVVTTMTLRLFELLTRKQLRATFVRYAVALLDVWQAFVVINANYWIPQLTGVSATLFTWYSVILAVLSVTSLFVTSLGLAATVLTVNIVQYLLLTYAALWISDPPRASAGMTAFIAIVCIPALFRICILIARNQQDNP